MSLETCIFGGTERSRSILSKRKGSDNERAVAKFFTKWVGEKFARVPMSGGLSGQWEGNRNMVGDVVPISEQSKFSFSVETKFYRNIKFGELGKRNKVYGFWKQASQDAELAGKFPMLIIRQNQMPAGEFILFLDKCMDSGIGIAHVSSGIVPESKITIYGYNTTTLLEKVPYKQFLDVYLSN